MKLKLSKYLPIVFLVIILLLSVKKSKVILTEIVNCKHINQNFLAKTINCFPEINEAFVLGKFNYKTHPSFIKVNPKYTSKTIYLHKDTNSAFEKMRASALKDGITLTLISGTRSFYEQKAIWERKWKKYSALKPLQRAKKILQYSAMPSTSRHHWGSDIDLNSLNNAYFKSGMGKKVYQWLIDNANNFGFHQTYTNVSYGRTGYNEEKWHWSYLPLANHCLKFYNKKITYNAIIGFKGDSLAAKMQIIEHYVNGISEKVKQYR